MSGNNSLVYIEPRLSRTGSGPDLPFVLHDEGPICADKVPAPPQPATAEQAAEIIRLLTDIRDQLARAFGPGR